MVQNGKDTRADGISILSMPGAIIPQHHWHLVALCMGFPMQGTGNISNFLPLVLPSRLSLTDRNILAKVLF